MHRASKQVWITWQNHRRTNELSKALGVQLFTLLRGGSYLEKVFVLSLKTVALLRRLRPGRVIVQNPSMVLASLVCFVKPLFGFKVIVDRHSNFKFATRHSPKLKYRVFHCLSRYTIRKADLTIVTNEFLRGIVEKWGGRGFVLQDKLPELPYSQSRPPQLAGKHNITYICSFSDDEPVDEVLKAARSIDKSIVIYVTGNPRKYLSGVRNGIPEKVIFTGFLPEKDYQSLLGASDAIMALTRGEHLLLCGAYEAISLRKPLILSDTNCLRGYFGAGPVFTLNKARDIAMAIRTVAQDKAAIALKMDGLRGALEGAWKCAFSQLHTVLASL